MYLCMYICMYVCTYVFHAIVLLQQIRIYVLMKPLSASNPSVSSMNAAWICRSQNQVLSSASYNCYCSFCPLTISIYSNNCSSLTISGGEANRWRHLLHMNMSTYIIYTHEYVNEYVNIYNIYT